MRLINASTLELCDFTLTEVPPYMILSHTWGEDEVTFRDMSSTICRTRRGFYKIENTCRLALENQLEYIWIDTCCIDKSSSAELTESINSMFSYYTDAAVCVVYFVDLPSGRLLRGSACRWFTRGWTLQELLAPRTHWFYDQEWTWIGSKSILIKELAILTDIPEAVLAHKHPLSKYPIAMRMFWAAHRQTTRLEDMAYCLLGIFEVNMPLIYGEGHKAFRRLQLEIIKENNDLTIFGWERPAMHPDILGHLPYTELLAQSPCDFAKSGKMMPFPDDYPEFSVTNKGLVISPDIRLRVIDTQKAANRQQLAICLGFSIDNGTKLCILLNKVGPGLFYRQNGESLVGLDQTVIEIYSTKNESSYSIMINPNEKSMTQVQLFRNHAIHVTYENSFRLIRAVPERLWDPRDQVFLRPKLTSRSFPSVLGIWFEGAEQVPPIHFIVLCDNRSGQPRIASISDDARVTMLQRKLFHTTHREESLSLDEINKQVPNIIWTEDLGGVVASHPDHEIVISTSQSSLGATQFDLKVLRFSLE